MGTDFGLLKDTAFIYEVRFGQEKGLSLPMPPNLNPLPPPAGYRALVFGTAAPGKWIGLG